MHIYADIAWRLILSSFEGPKNSNHLFKISKHQTVDSMSSIFIKESKEQLGCTVLTVSAKNDFLEKPTVFMKQTCLQTCDQSSHFLTVDFICFASQTLSQGFSTTLTGKIGTLVQMTWEIPARLYYWSSGRWTLWTSTAPAHHTDGGLTL